MPGRVHNWYVNMDGGGKCENAEVVAELDRETKEGAKGLFAFFEKKKLELD